MVAATTVGLDCCASEAIHSRDLAFSEGNDLIQDVGLQACMREVLDMISGAWLLPAMAVVLSRPPTSDAAALYVHLRLGDQVERSNASALEMLTRGAVPPLGVWGT